MTRTRRRVLIVLCVTAALLLVTAAGVALRLWWPNADKLSGYAARGDVAGVRLCLRLGVDPNEPSRWGWYHDLPGPTPLTTASEFGHVEVIRLLLDNGADPNLRDFGSEFPQNTPVATAAIHGQLHACRVLLEAGADPNVPTATKQSEDMGPWTALNWALHTNHTAIADLLRTHGAVEGRRRSGEANLKH